MIQNIKFYWLITTSIIISFSSWNPITTVTQTTTLKNGAVYHYNRAEISEQETEARSCHTFYNRSLINPYFNFIIDTTKKIEAPAATQSKNHFDALYDNLSAIRIWNNFSELNQTLTTTKLSNQLTLSLDWNQLYHKVRISDENIMILDNLQLRFYNIMAKIYRISNLLRLVQKIELNKALTYFSKTIYYPSISALMMHFNPAFCDARCIEHEYQINHLVTSAANVASLHEYAQALIFYAYNNPQQRKKFNTLSVFNSSLNNKVQLKDNCHNTKMSNAQIFSDITESLIWNLISKSGIDTGDDPVKKMLIPFLIVDSSEARTAWIVNNVNERDKFFTEAFSKWLGTPSAKRDFGWQLLNDYFMNFFPKFYQF